MIVALALSVAVLAFPDLGEAREVRRCVAVAVHDGDGIVCNGRKIRIANIDAPELEGSPRCEAWRVRQLRFSKNPAWCNYVLGERARAALAGLAAQGEVTVRLTGERSYEREMARVFVDGQDVGAWLISRGLARRWVERRRR